MIRRSLLGLVALCFTTLPAPASELMVMEPYARASLTSGAQSGTAYMTLMNHGAAADALIAIQTDAAAAAEVHGTQNEDGVMKMRPMGRIEIKPYETVILAPGGLHVMLTGLKAPLKDGDTLRLTLVFEKAGEIAVDVPIHKLDAAPASEHEHMEQETIQGQ